MIQFDEHLFQMGGSTTNSLRDLPVGKLDGHMSNETKGPRIGLRV